MIGLAVHDVESAQTAGFIWVFPLVFASTVFVPLSSMPGWLQAFARVNPITCAANAVRTLTIGRPDERTGAVRGAVDRRDPGRVHATGHPQLPQGGLGPLGLEHRSTPGSAVPCLPKYLPA